MTEEQWKNKRNNKQSLTEGKRNDQLKKAVYRFISGTFYLNPPRDKKSIALVQKYLYTGDVSKAESKQIYKLFDKQLYFGGAAVGAFLAGIIGFMPAAVIAIILGALIKKYGAKWLTPTFDNRFISPKQAEEYKKMNDKDSIKKTKSLAGKATVALKAKILKLLD